MSTTMTRDLSRVLAFPLGLALALAAALPGTARADKPELEPLLLDVEIDPLPFARRGYGVQFGVRHPALRGVRISIANFSLDVPGFAAELGGNDGFELRVRWSPALYVLYYLAPPGRNGFAFGGAVRLLRLRYRHESEAGEAEATDLAPEAIAAYQWHPLPNGAARGLYVQPWIGLSATVLSRGERTVGSRTYEPLPIQPFFTVNIGWELSL
jgi:hypothetical protein